MSAQRSALLLAATALVIACGVDERPLVYKLSARSGSAASAGEDSAVPSPAGGAKGRGTVDGGAPGDSDQNAAGAAEAAASGAAGNAGVAGNGGSPTSGGAGATSSEGGTSAAGGDGGSAPDYRCGDSNRDRIDDCEQSELDNAGFDSAATGWEPEPLLRQAWSPTDARGAPGSGSLSVSNVNVIPGLGGSIALGSRQCVAAWMGQTFTVAARTLIKSGQGSGQASLNLAIYAGDDCGGDFIEGKTIGQVYELDRWRTIAGEVTLPAAARSMYVRLLAIKPLSQDSFEVLFDDVVVSEKK